MKHTESSARRNPAATKTRNERKFSSAAYLRSLMAELDRAAISHRIQQAREQVGLTQEELGHTLDPAVHWRTVQTWESPKQRTIPFDRLGEIARITQVSKTWLLHGVTSEEANETIILRRLDEIEKKLDQSAENVLEILRQVTGDPEPVEAEDAAARAREVAAGLDAKPQRSRRAAG